MISLYNFNFIKKIKKNDLNYYLEITLPNNFNNIYYKIYGSCGFNQHGKYTSYKTINTDNILLISIDKIQTIFINILTNDKNVEYYDFINMDSFISLDENKKNIKMDIKRKYDGINRRSSPESNKVIGDSRLPHLVETDEKILAFLENVINMEGDGVKGNNQINKTNRIRKSVSQPFTEDEFSRCRSGLRKSECNNEFGKSPNKSLFNNKQIQESGEDSDVGFHIDCEEIHKNTLEDSSDEDSSDEDSDEEDSSDEDDKKDDEDSD